MSDELQYLNLLKEIHNTGFLHENRTATDTKRLIAKTMRFDLSNGSIPVFTTKKVHWKSVVIELLWFLSGQTNVNFLKDHGVRIWNEWAEPSGDLGPVYGEQFRQQVSMFKDVDGTQSDNDIDPLKDFIQQLKDNPESRRHIISLWNAPAIPFMNLPPCHGVVIQASVIGKDLYLEMYQRSCDMFLGVPFNVASYGLFTHMIARECGLNAKELIWHGHDCHVYVNHAEQLNVQVAREIYTPPKLDGGLKEGALLGFLEEVKMSHGGLSAMKTEEIMWYFQLKDYKHHDAIKAEVAV